MIFIYTVFSFYTKLYAHEIFGSRESGNSFRVTPKSNCGQLPFRLPVIIFKHFILDLLKDKSEQLKKERFYVITTGYLI